MQDFEFTVQDGSSTCCKPATASARVPPQCVSRSRWRKKGLIDEKKAVLRVAPAQLDQLLHPVFDTKTLGN